jgi:serine/threonine protein kinase
MTPAPELDDARSTVRPLPSHTLPLGTRLRDYEITGLAGEGTCSIVYLGWDHSLQRKVAVKEYMPAALAARVTGAPTVVTPDRHFDTFRAGLNSFLNEARLLARFDHPSLVKVYRFWEENGTAYMVMPCHEGPTLKVALAELGHVPSEDELRAWLKPILNAVTVLHEGGTWHQNIGPDEIILTPVGPILLGFASAAHAIEAIHHTPAAALKPGFAAIEQYGGEAGSTRGPWTDLYALAAVIYAAITGAEPAAAADRLANDRLRPLTIVAAGLYSAGFLAAIDAAMAVQPKQRPADHGEFRALMGDIEAPEAVSLTPRRDLMQEPFVGAPTTDREITVPDRPVAPITEPPVATAAPASEPKAPVAARAAAVKRAPRDPARAAPSWMRARNMRSLGKRALYGVVAGTCALIGIAALVLQFATRPATRTPLATAAASAPLRSAAASAPRLPPAVALVASMPATLPAARPAVATTTPPTRTAPVAATVATPPPAPAALATAPASAPPTARAPVTVAAAAPPAPASIAPATPIAMPVERQARCIEILQKASLEKITPAETDFFKRECK